MTPNLLIINLFFLCGLRRYAATNKEVTMAKTYVPKILVVDDEKVIRDITQAF